MKIYRFGEEVPFKTSITIGMFDGVHRGHQALVKKALDFAKGHNLTPLVYTFYNHPVKELSRKYITLLEEKLFLLEHFGIKYVYLAELNREFMEKTPEEFLKGEICEKVHAKSIVVGKNFRFGKNRSGDVQVMEKILRSYGIDVFPAELFYYNGKPISSSIIHSLINDGDIKIANELLGYSFFLSGKIISGKGIGRLLGFPTANLDYFNGYKVLPSNGVYITVASVEGTFYKSVTNVGFNPTFENSDKTKVEIHFIDEQINLYGKSVRLHFLKRLREEKKFPNAELLMEQIERDVHSAKEFFKNKTSIEVL